MKQTTIIILIVILLIFVVGYDYVSPLYVVDETNRLLSLSSGRPLVTLN